MINKWTDIFCDNNSINEKAIIGAGAFLMMCFFALIDITTGVLGRDLIVNEFIFNAFTTLVLGSFGISAVEKVSNIFKGNKEEKEESINEEN